MILQICLIFAICSTAAAFLPRKTQGLSTFSRLSFTSQQLTDLVPSNMASENKKPEEKYGFERLQDALEKADADPKKSGRPPIYEPGSYPTHLLAALAYLIPIVDASDLGKYMFEAYPAVSEIYNGLFGAIAGVYNGVPFLPFAIFFIMSYICRAPSFPGKFVRETIVDARLACVLCRIDNDVMMHSLYQRYEGNPLTVW